MLEQGHQGIDGAARRGSAHDAAHPTTRPVRVVTRLSTGAPAGVDAPARSARARATPSTAPRGTARHRAARHRSSPHEA